MPDDSELSRIDPEPVTHKLSTGFAVDVVRLRTRQFFRLLKILTHGAGPALMQAGLDFQAAPEEFGQKLLILVVMSIPDAEQEAVAFLQSMCQPHGIILKQDKLTKQETETNKVLWEEFAQEMHNPLPMDAMDLIEVIVRQEAPDLQALGKKAAALLKVAGLNKDEKPEEAPSPQELAEASPVASQPSSTSSVTSTDGETNTSSTSPSAGSASVSRRRSAVSSVSS
jgi:hypothetical protein